MEGGQDLICQQEEEERVVGAISPIRQAWSGIASALGTPSLLQLKPFHLTCAGDTNDYQTIDRYEQARHALLFVWILPLLA